MNPRLHRRTYVEVDLARLERNFHTLRKLLPPNAFCCPMVKANAYGHGDVEVATQLELAGVKHLGVGLVEEGVRLREAGVRVPLLLFGIFEEFSVDTILENKLTPVISHWSELEILADHVPFGSRFALHLKFNTGMNRLGFDVSEALQLRDWLDTHQQFSLEGVATHLLRGEDAGEPDSDSGAQLEQFARALGAFQGLRFHAHALNSSAAVQLHARDGRLSYGMRPGLALYGVMPSTRATPKIQLEPCLSFRSHVVMTHRLNVGEAVSYNAIWKASRPSLIGVIPAGYADGFQRQFSNSGEVLCRGRRAPVVGTVCMDYFMVDLTDVEAASGAVGPGEEVVMIGDSHGENQGIGLEAQLGADELARRVSTIPYEIFTRISERVPRHYRRSDGVAGMT
ncbi:MAG: alanine racemase [Bdellovibrionaceae bacterium]|nr:alanine racemase [Pseudobdellovibrionaceae bacterium]